MKRVHLTAVLILFSLISACDQLERVPLKNPAFDEATLQRMRAAVLENQDEILAERNLQNSTGFPRGWVTDNPYNPPYKLNEGDCDLSPNCSYARDSLNFSRFPAQESVYRWWKSRGVDESSAEACGMTFTNDEKTAYRLKTFSSLAALQEEGGYYLTHFQACGTCSSLQDLAVYGELDLTAMAKTCSKRPTLEAKKRCMMEIGFTEACAETWAYNAENTTQSCTLTCIETYGLMNLITGTENVPNVDEDGNLNPCILCDEMISGPGFQYAAGRTRRSSGIVSEIDRPSNEIYTVPHDYFLK